MSALLDTAGAERAVLVGHSLGGYASLLFRLQHPERVRALVLFGSGPGYRDAEARQGWNDMAERFAASVEKRGLDILQKASAEVSGAAHRSPAALAHAARGMLAQKDSSVMDTITEIDVPTLVLIGAEDKPFIGSSEYMAKKIPGAELVVIEGAGHAASIESRRRSTRRCWRSWTACVSELARSRTYHLDSRIKNTGRGSWFG